VPNLQEMDDQQAEHFLTELLSNLRLEEEYNVRYQGYVIEIPQPGERIRGRETFYTLPSVAGCCVRGGVRAVSNNVGTFRAGQPSPRRRRADFRPRCELQLVHPSDTFLRISTPLRERIAGSSLRRDSPRR
jgi:hypothetical protein